MVGLVPSAVAAQVLADDLGIVIENTATWWTTHQHTGATFQAGQLVIIDEASLADALSLDRITQAAQEAGAKVLLVGDYAQLQSGDADSAFSLLIHDRDDAPELVAVHRFTLAGRRPRPWSCGTAAPRSSTPTWHTIASTMVTPRP
ncbi:AAA family ATPase [Buchananella hordeovulneris]|uniref:AAA family ATPase n=1 Tax=Buchananella hordeovulneris TaxID=52770 RepID=UPI001C9E49AE|nr:AAA family ATPase [Buchananella hordeovulneris]